MKKYLILSLFLVSRSLWAAIGNTNNGTTTDSIWNSSLGIASINATRFQSTTNETVSTITAKIVGMTGKYQCAIYAGNASAATTFLMGTSEVINPTNGWNTFTLTSPVSITNAQYYYLAVWGNASPAAVYITSGGFTVWRDITYSANWPSPFSQGGTFTATYCIYADGVISTNTPPPPVTNTVSSVTLAWDASPDASVVGYKVYYGNASRSYTNNISVTNVLTATVTNLIIGATYYFGATAFNGSGLESDFSNEAIYTVPISLNTLLYPPGLRVKQN